MATQQGLFGVSPEQLMQGRADQDYARNLQAVQLTPMQQGNLMLRQGASELGRVGGSLLGIEDPQLQAAKEAQSLASQFDVSTAAGLKDLTMALQQRAQQTGNQALASLIPQAAAAYQKAALNEATIADKLEKKTPAAEEQAKRVRYDELVEKLGPQAGAMAFFKEMQAAKEGVAKAGVAPAVKAAGNISGVVSAYQGTVKPYTETIDAAETTVSLINEAQKTANPTAYEGARVQLARAVGNSSLSRRDIEAAGGDPSIAGKITNTTSELFTGIPTEATLRDIARAANIVKKAAQIKKDKITMQQRDIAESEFGLNKDALDRQFPLSPKAGGKASATEVKTLDWNTYAAPKR